MGLQDVLFNKQEIKLARPLDAYVMENVLFKVSYPAEFHAQTAAECAVILHPQVKDRIDEIDRVVIRTHESAIRIIDKKARFTIRQIVITAFNTSQQSVCFLVISQRKDYEAETAIDPRIDKLRGKMEVTENKVYTEDYLKPDKRSISNAVQIHLKTERARRWWNVNFRSAIVFEETRQCRNCWKSFLPISKPIF